MIQNMKIHPRLREQKKTTNTQLRGVTHCIRLIVAEYVGGLTFTPREVLGSSPTRTHFFFRVFQSRHSLCVVSHCLYLFSSPPPLSPISHQPYLLQPPPPCPPRRKVIYLVLEVRVGNLSVLSAAKVPALFSRERPISPDPSPQILA